MADCNRWAPSQTRVISVGQPESETIIMRGAADNQMAEAKIRSGRGRAPVDPLRIGQARCTITSTMVPGHSWTAILLLALVSCCSLGQLKVQCDQQQQATRTTASGKFWGALMSILLHNIQICTQVWAYH